MTQVLAHPPVIAVEREPTSPEIRWWSHRLTSQVLFGSTFVLYLVAAWILALQHHAIVGDAMARVANGSYVLFSRDPHLAAVGFVWNPLPSFAAATLLPFSPWWPELKTQAFAGNIVSALFMAGTVTVIARQLAELGVRRWIAGALTALVAIHPMIVLYGANGDSEASLLFFLALACLGLTRFISRRDLASLVLTGVALGLGYLSRQEFLAGGVATIVVVLTVGYRAAHGSQSHRRRSALTDATLVGLPLLFSVACWAGSAFIIVGTATSYLDANSEQVDAAQFGISTIVGGTGAIERAAYNLGQLLALEPFWSVIVVTAIALAWRRRDLRVLAPLATFGAVAGAQGLLFTSGSTFGWLRFAITIIPMTVLLVGFVLAEPFGVARTVHDARHRRTNRAVRRLVPIVGILACTVAIPSAVGAMTNPRWGREEAASVHLLPGYEWAPTGSSAYEPHWLDGYDRVAKYFDRLHLRNGSVLTDVQYTFPLVLKSTNPHQFVIPSDHDFERSVADPATYRVRYLLVSDGPGDVLARSYPELRANRASGIARLVRAFRAGPQTLRLYRVTRSVTDRQSGVRSG